MEYQTRHFDFKDAFSEDLFNLSSQIYETGDSEEQARAIYRFIESHIPLSGFGLVLYARGGAAAACVLIGSASSHEAETNKYNEGLYSKISASAGLFGPVPDEIAAELKNVLGVDTAALCAYALSHKGLLCGLAIYIRSEEKPFAQSELDIIEKLSRQLSVVYSSKAVYGAISLQNHVFNSVYNAMGAYLLVTDPRTNRILYMNDVMKKAYGLSDVEGKICHEEIRLECIKQCDHCPIKTVSSTEVSSLYDGDEATINGRYFTHYGGLIQWIDGSVAHYQCSVDITKSRQDTRATNIDELTNMFNRRAGKLALEKTLKKIYAEKEKISVCMFDVNSLKTVNDNYGHSEGDFLLSTIANTVQFFLSPSDFCFRLSGDEFIAVFPRQSQEEAAKYMDRALESLNEKRIALNKPYSMGFCYGVMETSYENPLLISEILRQTDARMYEQKRKYHLIEAVKKINDDSLASAFLGSTFTYDRESLYEALVKSTDDYIFVCNLESQVFQFPAPMVEEFYLPGEFIKNSPEVWEELLHPDDFSRFYELLSDIFFDRIQTFSAECRAKKRNGEYVYLRFLGYLTHNAQKSPTLFAGMIINLGKKNKVDNITGLYNKNEFETVVTNLLTYRPDARLGVLLIKPDEFKRINELHNREFGDAVLRRTGQKLQAYLPSNASLFRMDSAEFAVVFRSGNHDDVHEYFINVRNALDGRQDLNGIKYFLTISAGAAFYPMDAINYQDLYKYAGYALDFAKSSSKGSLCFFTREIMIHKTRILELMEMLRDSVEHNYRDFSINFQPQVNAATGKINGSEALLRWTSDKYGPLSPIEFIPLLEKSGLIHPVGRWVFRSAIETCKPWIDKQTDFTIGINMSYLQLTHPDFVRFVMDTIEEYAIMPKNIILEITENFLESSTKTLSNSLRHLRDMGIRVAMDDFGTGYSSLDILKMNPADIVKIDRVFVSNLRNSKFDATFIQFIVALCHEVNIKVCLEGVESPDDYSIVQPMDLDTIQGYLFGRPLSAEEFEKLMEDKR